MELKDKDRDLYSGIMVKKEYIPPEDIMVEFYDKAGSKIFFNQNFDPVLVKDEFQATMEEAKNHIIYAREKQKTTVETTEMMDIPLKVQKRKKERKYKCSICEKGFYSNYILRNHSLVHTREKNFQCALCEKRFGMKSSLARHLEEIHFNKGKPSWPCGLCSKILKTAQTLKDHLMLQHSDDPVQLFPQQHTYQWQCNVCQKKFRKKYHMQRHIMTVHEGKKQSDFVRNVSGTFICPQCNKIFDNKYNFNRHAIVHSDFRPFKCPMIGCEMNFKKKYTMQRHFLIHEKEKTLFTCALCSASFAQKTNLVPHMKIHLGRSREKCTYCEKYFSHSYIKMHIKTVHQNVLKNNNND